jgi:hypothetical protein
MCNPAMGRVLLSLGLFACGPRAEPESPSPEAALVEVSGGALEEAPAGERLWILDDGIYEEHPPGERRLVVALSSGRVSASDLRGGESGFLIPQLQHRMGAFARAPALAIGIAPAIPSPTIERVFYTSGQASHPEMRLLVRDGAGVRSIPLVLPTFGSPGLLTGRTLGRPAEPDVTLHLSVRITSEGAIVAGDGGKLRPGCEEVGAGPVITVPLRDGAHDWTELARCLAKVKEQFPDEDEVVMSADGDIAWRVIAEAMIAVRGAPERPLFTSLSYSASMR